MAGNKEENENEKNQIDDTENGSKKSNGDSNGKKHGIDPTSLFYMHPSDHPGMNICPVTLKGDNYQEWETSMRNAFRAKRKLGLNGTVTQPDASEIEDWWSVKSMLRIFPSLYFYLL
jgi:hypothetical protein